MEMLQLTTHRNYMQWMSNHMH